MKARNFLEFLGLRQKPRHFPYTTTEIPGTGGAYASWMHPKEQPKTIDRKLVEAYAQFIKPGDFCIDIGAHTGDTTVPMALAAGKSGKVLALEPNPYVYHVLEKNSRLNAPVANIETIMAAASRDIGFTEFEYSDAGFCNGGRHEGISPLVHGHAYKLEVFCIDLEKELIQHYEAFLPRLSFLKVDAEGFDFFILQNLQNLLHSRKPVIKAEIYKESDEKYRTDFLQFLTRTGYEVRIIEDDPCTHGEILQPHAVMFKNHYDILAQPA